MSEKILLSELMKTKQEAVPAPEVVTQPTESKEENDRKEQAKREKAREDRQKMAELRQRLGLPQLDSVNEEILVPVKKEKPIEEKPVSPEKVERLSFSLKHLVTDMEELSSTLSRNRFPRIRFESEQKTIGSQLESMVLTLSRVKLPEDSREMMELEPRNYTAVIDVMEKIEGDLLKLKGTLEVENEEEVKKISDAMKSLRSKKDLFQSAVGALRRYKGR